MDDNQDAPKQHIDEGQNANGGLNIPANEEKSDAAAIEASSKKFDYGTGDSDEGDVPVDG